MSRIGKKPILIPENVEVKIDGGRIVVKGPKGEEFVDFRPEVQVEEREGKIYVFPSPEHQDLKKNKQIKAFWGLSRALIANAVKGVTSGFEKKLEIQGIGYKANVEGQVLVLNVGFSHPVKLEIPQSIKVAVEKNIITVSGQNKGTVGQFSAIIRKTKPPEPYKGKGIRYFGEQVRRKAGKKLATAKA